jgi:GntR family transcriptional regulator/MocR family aminotransferase
VNAEALPRSLSRSAPAGAAVSPRSVWHSIAQPTTAPSSPPPYDFAVGVPDARLFPLTPWRRLVTRELRPTAVRRASYAEPAGSERLRTSIARYIGIARSVRAGADDVLVTQGAQQAFDLIGRVLIDPGTIVAVEEPGYPPVRELFQSLGARVIGVPVDEEGLDVSALPRSARLVYVTPSHQFPLGVPMSLSRRAGLLAWAERRNAVVIEDDYDSEFRFEGRPLEPLQSLDRGGRVIYVGSFSKTMLPALRLGFMVAPASLQPALRNARRLSDWHGDLPTQAALGRFIDEGLLARHVRKTLRDYAARRARILAGIERDCSQWLRVVPSAAGLHVTFRARAGVDADRVRARARADGVAMSSLSQFCAARPVQHGFVIGYGAIPLARIDEGLRRFASAFRR